MNSKIKYIAASDSQNNQVQKNEEMNIEARKSLNEQDFFGIPVITIKNINSVEWGECKLTLNKDYNHSLNTIYKPDSLKSEKDNIDYMIQPIAGFTKDDGTKFDISTTEIKSLSISCQKPFYGFWYGEF